MSAILNDGEEAWDDHGGLWPHYTSECEPRHNMETCPECNQNVTVYKRSLDRNMVKSFERAYEAYGTEFGHWPSVLKIRLDLGRSESLLRHWGLIEASSLRKQGVWRVTELGEQWIERRVLVPQYAHIFNKEALGFTGPFITLQYARATKLDREHLIQRGGSL